MSNVAFLLLHPSFVPMNGVKGVWPANCLSIFYFVRIPLAVSTPNIKSSMEKSTQHNIVGSLFLKTSNT